MKNQIKKVTLDYSSLNLSAQSLKFLNELSQIRNATSFRIQYKTDCSANIAKKYELLYSVTKVTTTSLMKGINYEHLKSVKERRQQEIISGNVKPKKEMWYTHLDKMLLKHNTKEQYYIMVFPNINKKAKPQSQYFLNGKPIDTENLKNMGIMQPSFWNSKSERRETFTLSLDNIIKIFPQNKIKK